MTRNEERTVSSLAWFTIAVVFLVLLKEFL